MLEIALGLVIVLMYIALAFLFELVQVVIGPIRWFDIFKRNKG